MINTVGLLFSACLWYGDEYRSVLFPVSLMHLITLSPPPRHPCHCRLGIFTARLAGPLYAIVHGIISGGTRYDMIWGQPTRPLNLAKPELTSCMLRWEWRDKVRQDILDNASFLQICLALNKVVGAGEPVDLGLWYRYVMDGGCAYVPRYVGILGLFGWGLISGSPLRITLAGRHADT